MRNYPLSKKFEWPLLAALNISRDPFLVFLKFETPPTYLGPQTTASGVRRTSEANQGKNGKTSLRSKMIC